MTQYAYNFTIGDGERILISKLLNQYIEECKSNNKPIGLIAEQLFERINHNIHQSIPKA